MKDFIATFYVDDGDDFPDRVLCKAHVAAKDTKAADAKAGELLEAVHKHYGANIDHPVKIDDIDFFVDEYKPMAALTQAKCVTAALKEGKAK